MHKDLALHVSRFFDTNLPGFQGGLIVACSGGPDSMVLASILHHLYPSRIILAHFNHQIRGKESQRDEEFVRLWAEKNTIPFFKKTQNIPALARKKKQGIEESARDARYCFLRSIQKKHPGSYIITGHNADDQAETILFRILRGTGVYGLSGIPAMHETTLRPLLPIFKDEILAYAQKNNIPFVIDSTNLSTEYTRNYIRLEILPRLNRINTQAKKHLIQLGKQGSELTEVIENHLLDFPFTKHSFALAQYFELPRILQGEVIRRIFLAITGSADGVSERLIEEIDKFFRWPGNPRHKDIFGVYIQKKNGIISYKKSPR